jgi:hypothetical protein
LPAIDGVSLGEKKIRQLLATLDLVRQFLSVRRVFMRYLPFCTIDQNKIINKEEKKNVTMT